MGLLSSECGRQVAMPLMLSGGGRAAHFVETRNAASTTASLRLGVAPATSSQSSPSTDIHPKPTLAERQLWVKAAISHMVE
jgi:hypothetical protein